MPYRLTPFINEHFYHVFNRGVEKRQIFSDLNDHDRFLQTLYYYRFAGPKPRFSTHKQFKTLNLETNPKIIEIVCYCLMPNHFHLLLKQKRDKGIQEFISQISNSYARYYNTKNKRIGPLFQGEFKAVLIENDEQLTHLSRYIHLNPYVSGLTNNAKDFPYSSYHEYLNNLESNLCSKDIILDLFKNTRDYEEFVTDHQTYALELEKIKDLIIEEE